MLNRQGRPTTPGQDSTVIHKTFTGNRALQIEEPLIFEMGRMQIGGISEARDHATGFRAGWKMVPGAISWLRTASHAIEAELAAAAPKKKPKKVSATTLNKRAKAAIARVADLPVSDESWVLD